MPTPTISWAVDGDGNWSNADDWSLARLPNSTDDVAINTAHLHTVTHSTGTDSVRTLTVGVNSRLLVSGGLLRLDSTSSFGNLLTVSGGTLALDGATTVAAFSQGGGTVSGSGVMTVTGAATLTSTLLHTARGTTLLKGATTFSGSQFGLDGTRTLENQGTFKLTGSAQLLLGFNPFGTSLGGGTLKNDSGGTIDLEGFNFISTSSGVTAFSNAGTLERTVGTSDAIIDVALTNTGLVSVQTGILEIDRAFTTSGAGTISISSGAKLDIHGGGSANAGAITVAAGGILDISGSLGVPVFTLGAGTMGGTGEVDVSDATLDIGGAVTIAGVFKVSGQGGDTSVAGGATLKLTGGGSAQASALFLAAGGTLDLAGGRFSLSSGLGAVDGSGTLELSAGRLAVGGGVTVDGGFTQIGGTLSGTKTFTVAGAATFQGKKMAETGSGVTLLEGSSTLSGRQSVLSLDGGRVLENQGTFVCTDGDFHLGFNPFGTSVGGGTIQNDAGAIFNLQETAFFIGGSGTVAFKNAGTFEQTVTTGDTQMDVPITNTGTISVQSGDIAFAEGGSSSGAITIAAGAALILGTLANGTFSLGGTVSGPGLLEVSGGTMAVDADLSLGGAFLQLESTVSGAGNLTVTGAATFASPDFNGALLETGSGKTVLEGASTFDQGTTFALDGGRVLEIENTFKLTGTGNILLGDNPFGTSLGGGSIQNDAGATIDIQGANQILASSGVTSFINNGVLKKSVGTGLAVIGVAFTDGGAVKATSGVLEFTQTLSGGGTMSVNTGATLQADAAAASSLSMTFNGGTATLALGAASAFAATIKGFAPTDIIDLLKTAADAATLGAGDTLVITNAGATVATLQLAGNFAGDTFHVASDGAGGANVTVTAGAPVAPAPAAPTPAPRPILPFVAAMAGMVAGAPAHAAAALHAEAWPSILAAPRRVRLV